MDSNPCTTSCIIKKLGRKKTKTKVVHNNVSQGYNRVQPHIMKHLPNNKGDILKHLWNIRRKHL